MKVVQHMGVGGDGAEDVEGVLLGSGGMLAVLEYTVSTQYVGMSSEGYQQSMASMVYVNDKPI